MKTIDYLCKRFEPPVIYQLVKLMPKQHYQLYYGNTLIGTFAVTGDHCEQTGGRQILDEMIEDIYQLIK